MKRIALLLALGGTLAAAQTTPTKPAPKAATATPAVHRPGTTTSPGVKLPPGVKPVRGVLKTAFSLKYQDFVIGTGAPAEPGQVYQVHYTGWLASDGTKFDSSYDHRIPLTDKDGKPVMDADGKPKLGDAEPISFPQGRGRLIPGWDQGFEGMKVGGKRRLFIPYQLAYGALGRPPRIPAKTDLIFDVELIKVMDMPTQPQPGMQGRPMPPRPGGAPAQAPAPGAPARPSAPQSTPAPAATPNPATPPPAATPNPEQPK